MRKLECKSDANYALQSGPRRGIEAEKQEKARHDSPRAVMKSFTSDLGARRPPDCGPRKAQGLQSRAKQSS